MNVTVNESTPAYTSVSIYVVSPHSCQHVCMYVRDGMTRYQVMAARAVAIERRLRGEPADLTDPIERVKAHCHRIGAASVRYKV